ncbi:MATE family efflux transporter, partial [Chloroflexota bacterium]
ILAAQNLGAGKPERAERGGWLGVGFFTCLAAVISIAIWFWAEKIIGIFDAEPALVSVASGFLRIQIVSYMSMGLVVVLSMCIEGTGDTVPSMIITLATMWIIQIPLAYFIANHTGIGVYGVPWSIALALICRAVFYSIYFRSGRWKRRKV